MFSVAKYVQLYRRQRTTLVIHWPMVLLDFLLTDFTNPLHFEHTEAWGTHLTHINTHVENIRFGM